MTVSATLWAELVTALSGIFKLDGDAFITALHRHDAILLAIAVVVIAGLSETIAESIVLFANRVRAARFFLSILVNVALFVFGYVFTVLSTWAVMALPGQHHAALGDLAIVIALSYAPLVFAFFGTLPYLGVTVIVVLRVWHLLSMVVGAATLVGVPLYVSLTYVGLGWFVLTVAQATVGRPIVQLGSRALDAAAGVSVADNTQLAIDRLSSDDAMPTSAPGGNGGPISATPIGTHAPPAHATWWKGVLGILFIAALAYIVFLTLAPLHQAAFGWQDRLPKATRVPLDLLWISLVGVIVAGFLAPLETIGWWAGWYGDELDTASAVAGAASSGASSASRYVVYLDGISQSSSKYMPDVEHFLDALAPRLPSTVQLVRGVMCYSVMNRPLEDDPILSGLWRMIDALRFRNPRSLLGMLINLRNVLIVAVSADTRYGPMYNYSVGQVVYDSLIANGYRRGSGIPVTLLGFSGGGQMAAASAAFVRRAIDGPVDVISLGGVISGNCRLLEVEHLYHFRGEKDNVQRLGPILFPTRWKIAVLSKWNRALRLGRLSIYSLGPIGHQVPGGIMDPNLRLPDGRTSLEQTIDDIVKVLDDRIESTTPPYPERASNYSRYVEAPWTQPAFYPLHAAVDANRYRPVAPWMGRLILPQREERGLVNGVWFEIHHAPEAYASSVGTTVKLRWSSDPRVQAYVKAVTHDVHFSSKANETSRFGGIVHPVRVDHWQLVDPLESLAGAHPVDDVVVMLAGDVTVTDDDGLTLCLVRQPVQISGRYIGLVRFAGRTDGDRFDVQHFDQASKSFGGPVESVRMPAPVADLEGNVPFDDRGIEQWAVNGAGWYIYGSPDADGTFVVQSLLPRQFLTVPSDGVEGAVRQSDAYHYVRRRAWPAIVAAKGATTAASLGAAKWQAGDTALLLHTYGGVGGPKGERAAKGPVYFGHFAFGFADVVQDAFTGELRFDITYEQVYTQNKDGLIAGALHMSRYLGDRQFGWLGLRPTCNVAVRNDIFGEPHDASPSAHDALFMQLEAMTARYRIGDGTGGTYVGAANNCSQDSGRALFAALRSLPQEMPSTLAALVRDLLRDLEPFGSPRKDWSDNEFNLGSTMEDDPLDQVRSGLGSWRTLLPRKASDSILEVFFRHGASATLIATDQIGERPEIAPVVPMTL